MKKIVSLVIILLSLDVFAKSVSMQVELIECVQQIELQPRCSPTKGTHSDRLFNWTYTNGYFCEVNVIYKLRGRTELSSGQIFESEKSKQDTLNMLEGNDIKYLKSLPPCI